jgi:hypothetical protein
MKIMIALPGEKYYALPREVLEKYALPKAQFDAELAAKKQSEVEGQSFEPDDGTAVLGVRG